MRNLFLAFMLTGLPDVSYSESQNWVLEQFRKFKASEIEAIAAGKIDGEEHVVTMSELSEENPHGPTILIFKMAGNTPSVVARIDLDADSSYSYKVSIQKNSIYLEHHYGHHGLHASRYQFKKIGAAFKMVGTDDQSDESDCYAHGDGPTNCGGVGVWSGSSHNLLTATSICWQEQYKTDNERDMKESSLRFDKWLQPRKGVRHKMKSSKIELPLLDGFDQYKFQSPTSCSFDKYNKLQK